MGAETEGLIMDIEKLTRFEPENVPRILYMHHQWINWKPREKTNGKIDKIPIDPRSLRPAKTNDRSTWGDFKTAVVSARKNNLGLGFVFSDTDNFVGIDLDDCFTDGKPKPWAQAIVDGLESYAEITPSGKGLHIIVKGELTGKRRRKGSVETYQTGRFFTVTGERLGTINYVVDNQSGLAEFYFKHFGEEPVPEPEPVPVQPLKTNTNNDILDGLKIVPAFQKLFSGDHSSYESQSEGDLALCSIIAKRTHDTQLIDWIFRQSGLMREKWDQLRGAETYGQITIVKALAGAPALPVIITSTRDMDEEIEQYSPFPSDIMSGLAGDFAKAQAECVEAPPEFLFMAFLTALGAMISGRATLATGWEIQPRLYLLILGETAEGRKSTALKIVTNFFTDAFREGEAAALKTSWGFGSAEGLQKRLDEHNHLLLCLDEFKAFVSKASIKSSVLLPAVTQLFEANSYENQTKTTHLKIENAHFSLLAASTIDTYERTWDASFSDIGFLNRLFLIVGKSERKFSFPRKLDRQTATHFKARLRQMIHKIHGADRGMMELQFSMEGQDLHNDWYLHREASVYSRRLNVYALRLMILMAINDGKQMIDAEVVEKVIQLCDWQLDIRKSLSPIDGDNAAAILEEKIRRALATKGDLTRRELAQYVNANRAGIWLFDTALNNLIKVEEVVKGECGKTLVHHLVQL